MYKKGREYSLEGVIQRFLEFAQLRDASTQAWELLDTRLNTFYGATLRVPMKKYENKISNYRYLVLGNNFLHMDDVKNYITENFDNPVFYKDYTYGNLLSISSGAFSVMESFVPDMFVFNGCESTIGNGESPRYTYDLIKSLEKICKENDIEFRLAITPSPQVFTDTTKLENYKKLLRSSFISKKPVIDCFGDGFVSSWTNILQTRYSNISVVNKGVDWNTILSLLYRFNDDVVQELPDICFIQVGINDLMGSVPDSSPSLADVKDNFSNLLNLCVKYDITPVIGLYNYTSNQLANIKLNNPTEFTKTVTEVSHMMNEYNNFCKELAISRNIKYIDFTSELRLPDGSANPDYFSADSRLLSASGEEKVGNIIADSILELIQYKESLSFRYKVLNLYDIFCNYLSVSELNMSNMVNLIEGSFYKSEVQEYIVNNIKDTHILDPIRIPYFYISFQHTNVTKKTYQNWLNTGLSIPEYVVKFIKEEYGYNGDGGAQRKIKHYYMSESYNHLAPRTGKGVTGLFNNEGEFVAVGLHSVFDFNLWMCEQGGITCEKEATEQANSIGFIPPQELQGAALKRWEKQPVFPGTGCPWFTVSSENKTDYDIINGGLDYWFTKSDCDATITIRFINAFGKEVYQSMSFGKMSTTDDDSYLFPLFVAGGNQALSGQVDIWVPRGAEKAVAVFGVVYDLDIKNASLVNSNLLFPTAFNGNDSSNFRVMASDGTWQNIITLKQSLNKSPGNICPKFSGTFGVILNAPEFAGGKEFNTSLPYSDDARNLVDTYMVKERFDVRKQSAMINNVVIYFKPNNTYGENGIMGTLPNSFFYGSRTCQSGEVIINNKKYLSVPNVWDDRLFYYPLGICEFMRNIEDWRHSEKIAYFYDQLFDVLMNYRFTHKLLIYLEDV